MNKVAPIRKSLEKLSKDEAIDLIMELLSAVEQLTNEVKELKEEIRIFKTPKNSRNSSFPPSRDMHRAKNKSLRSKSNRKTGGQPGHKGETLHQSKHPDEVINHYPDNICSKCGCVHKTDAFSLKAKRQVIDIPPIHADVIEHRVYESMCQCGHVSKGNFPAEVKAPVQYGNNLTTFVAYLNARQYIPYSRLPELIKCLTDISISEGTVFNMLNRTADLLKPVYEGIKNDVSKAVAVGSDETGAKIGKDKHWAWTWQSPTETYIVFSSSRGYVTIENEFPDGFPNSVLVSDSLSAQLKTPAFLHQLCLAHIMRELNGFIELFNNQWAMQMKALLQKAIKLKQSMSPSQYGQPFEARDEILREFEKYIDLPLQEDVSKLPALQKRLRKRANSVFTFLFHPYVPFDNNGSERAIRNIKVKQKVSGAFRSDRGADIFAITRSVIDTIIKRGGDVFEFLRFALDVSVQKKAFITGCTVN